MRNPTTTKNAPGEGNTRKIRKLCTQCIHPAFTRDSPGLQGRLLQPRSKAWENKPERSETMEQPPHGCDTTIPAPRKIPSADRPEIG